MSFLQILWAIILFPLAITVIWIVFVAIVTIVCLWDCREPKGENHYPYFMSGFFGNWFGPK